MNKLLTFLEPLAPVAKACMPWVVAAIIAALGTIGITEQMTVKEAITLLVTAASSSFLVYRVPNKQK